VWDALAAPLLALPPARRRSVLLLGLGGASAARAIRSIAPRARLVGVEIDPEVVEAARRFFDLDVLRLEVVVDDARGFLRRDRARYDLVIDDVFVGRDRRARKPAWLPLPGLADAAARLRPGGLLVTNTLDEAPAVARVMRSLFPSGLRLEIADYDNKILVGGRRRLSARALRAAIRDDPVLAPTLERLSVRAWRGPRKAFSDPRRGTATRRG
jgi:spermidine synthase